MRPDIRYAVRYLGFIFSLGFVLNFFIRKQEFLESITHTLLVVLVNALIVGIWILIRRR